MLTAPSLSESAELPAFTYLSDYQVQKFRSVPGDAELDGLLQELRQATGDDWLVEVVEIKEFAKGRWWPLRRAVRTRTFYALYADIHGEFQAINLCTPKGGSVFVGAHRDAVANYILGFLGGLRSGS